MADFFPVVVDSDNSILKELPSGDTLDLTESDIVTRNLQIDGVVHQTIVSTSGDIDLADGSYFTLSLSATATVTITGAPSGTATMFMLEVDNTGSYSISWPASVVWDGGVAPSLNPSSTTIFTFLTSDSGTTWRGNAVMNTSS